MTNPNVSYDIYPRFIEKYIDIEKKICNLCNSELEISIDKNKELQKCDLCIKNRKNVHYNNCKCKYVYNDIYNVVCNKCCKCSSCNNDIDINYLMSNNIKNLCNTCYNVDGLL
jgi:hypothetical protein